MNELSSASVSPAQPAPEAAPASQIPPPFSDVIAGALPAVSLPPSVRGERDQFFSFAADNLDELAAAGLEMHETPTKDTVFFNPAKISVDEIDKADKDGRLYEIAPPAAEVAAGAAQSSAAAQAPAAPAAPLANASAAAPAAPPADKRLQSARLQNTKALAPKKDAPNPVPESIGRRPV